MPDRWFTNPDIPGSRYLRRGTTGDSVAQNHPTWVEIDPTAEDHPAEAEEQTGRKAKKARSN